MTVRTSLKLQGRTRLSDGPEGSAAPVVSAQLSVRTIRTGTVIYRAHDKTKGALQWGDVAPAGGEPPRVSASHYQVEVFDECDFDPSMPHDCEITLPRSYRARVIVRMKGFIRRPL
jgi:hypothetical protein